VTRTVTEIRMPSSGHVLGLIFFIVISIGWD
jgi:hypothetical protein